jgi:hypothetical protein
MAQTRKRRQTKHKGNAAGMVEVRGRTGRKLEESERRKLDPKEEARRKRMERLDRPPTWRSSLNRAAIAAGLFAVVIIALLKTPPAAGLSLAAMMLLLYVPMSYYTDLFVYRRRQRKKAEAKGRA